MQADIHRLIEFQKLLVAFSQVDRTIHRQHSGKYIQENDTEHSYNLAMTAWYLAQWFPALNKNLLIQYGLVHDLVEIHAGDTYVYGTPDELASKVQREADALKKLDAEWADFVDMTACIYAYEHREDPESRFIYALDKIMPIMMVYVNDGHSWEEASVTVDMLYKAKYEKVKLSPEVLPYFEQIHELLLSRPDLIKPV
jgi:putative hydrolase of HD superfamily